MLGASIPNGSPHLRRFTGIRSSGPKAVRTGASSDVLFPISDPTRTLAVILASNESTWTGRPVDFEPFKNMRPSAAGLGQ